MAAPGLGSGCNKKMWKIEVGSHDEAAKSKQTVWRGDMRIFLYAALTSYHVH